MSWNKFEQQHIGEDSLLSFQAYRQKALPSVVRNEICLLHEQARLRCCRWACGLPQTPHLCASQDSMWQSQLRSSSRSFPFLFLMKMFFPSLPLSHQNHRAWHFRTDLETHLILSAQDAHIIATAHRPLLLWQLAERECENSLDRCLDSERKTERGKQTYGKLKNWLA